MDRDPRAREIMSAIGAILLKEWDPIGVKNEPMAQDEYDRYIGGVYRLLASGPTEQQIAAHLAGLEAGRMGLGTSSGEHLLPVARKLLSLDIKLESGPAA
jgi:hypothetical protein